MTPSTNPTLGLTAARYLKAVVLGKGRLADSQAYAASQAWRSTPHVLKALSEPIDTESGAALIPEVGRDYAEVLRPLTIIGRLQGLVRVPFRTRFLSQSVPTAASWVGEGAPKPVTASEFAAGQVLDSFKVAALCVITQELARASSPSAESLLLEDLARAGAQAIDLAFIDPANTGVTDVKPASVNSSVTPIPSTGSTVAQVDADLGAMLNALSAAGSDLAAATWVMRPRTAIYLSRLRGTGGAAAYPGITATGGTLLGVPVVTSGNVPVAATAGNPTSIVLLDQSGIALADDGEAALGVSMNASIQMDDAPASGAAQHVSMWQMNLACLRMDRFVNWLLRREGFVQVLSGVTY